MDTQTQTETADRSDTDRSWAARMAKEKEERDIKRHEQLRESIELVTTGVAQTGVKVDEMAGKVDAVFETVVGKEPTSLFGKTIATADGFLKKALPTLRVAGVAVAIGYGGYRGVQGVRGYLARRQQAKQQG